MTENPNLEERHYRYALEALFRQLRRSAYVFAARWSQLDTAHNPLLFAPGAVGDMSQRSIASLENHFDKTDLRRALDDFSFTKLLVENDHELWFHFIRPALGEHPTLDEQVYLRPLPSGFKNAPAQMILVASERPTDYLVNEIIDVFERGAEESQYAQAHPDSPSPAETRPGPLPMSHREYVILLNQLRRNPDARDRLLNEIKKRGVSFSLTPGILNLTSVNSADDPVLLRALESATSQTIATYGGKPLSEKVDAIKNSLELAIFSIFDDPECEINHIYFVPVVFPSASKKIAGIFSLYTADRLNAIDELLQVFQPFAQGIMAPHHFDEIEDQRKRFSLRSAIAAIMSRNISHNIGSHVLWHLSQELKS